MRNAALDAPLSDEHGPVQFWRTAVFGRVGEAEFGGGGAIGDNFDLDRRGCRGSRMHAAIARASTAVYVVRIAARRVLSALAETRGSRRRSDSPQSGGDANGSGIRNRP